MLEQFWRGFSAAVGETSELTISNVIDALDEDLGAHFFPADGENGRDPRQCPACADGRLGLKLGRNGGFVGCSNYPDCAFTRPLTVDPADGDAPAGSQGRWASIRKPATR